MDRAGVVRTARPGRRSSFDWALCFQWIVVTTLGWLLGRFLLPAAVPLAVGLAIGALQSLVLASRLRRVWRWAAASALGGAAGWALAFALLPAELDLLGGVLLGVSQGVAQWLVLRRAVLWAGWWIPVSTVAWTAGLALFPGLFSSGAVAGAITGTALELLLRTSRPAAGRPGARTADAESTPSTQSRDGRARD